MEPTFHTGDLIVVWQENSYRIGDVVAYRAELDAFVTGIERGTMFDPGFADGRAALVLADAANESMRSGATVKVAG